jgi:hypothetical protein
MLPVLRNVEWNAETVQEPARTDVAIRYIITNHHQSGLDFYLLIEEIKK